MRAKLLISTAGAVGLLGISIAAFASTLNGTLNGTPLKEEVQTTEMGLTAETNVTEASTAPLEVSTPEPVIETCQSKTGNMDLDDGDAYLLAKIAMAEAEGEDTEGKALVMAVVLNRVHSIKFPDTVYDVIHQKRQFSPVEDGRYYSSEPDADCMAALDLIINGWNESRGALYFESDSDSTWHRRHLRFLFQHGRHMFYTESE